MESIFGQLKNDCIVSFNDVKTRRCKSGVILNLDEEKKEAKIEVQELNGKKHVEVVPLKNIKVALNPETNQTVEIPTCKKIHQFEELLSTPLMKEIFNKHCKPTCDCTCFLKPVLSSKSGETVLKFQWNIGKRDWHDCPHVEVDAFARETPAAFELVVTKPVSKVYTITKKVGCDCVASASQLISNFMNQMDMMHSAIKAKHEVDKDSFERFRHDAAMRAFIINDRNNAMIEEAEEPQQEEQPVEPQQPQEEPQQAPEPKAKEKVEIGAEPMFELTDDTKMVEGEKLFRIRSNGKLQDQNLGIHNGSVGGYVASLDNVSVDPQTFVLDDACVYGNSYVESSIVKGRASISGGAKIKNSEISNDCIIKGRCVLLNSKISGRSQVLGDVKVLPKASLVMKGRAKIIGPVTITGDVVISENASIVGSGKRLTIDSAQFSGNTQINATGYIQGNPIFKGRNLIFGEVRIDTRKSPGSIFSNTNSSGLLQIKGQQVEPSQAKVDPDKLQDKAQERAQEILGTDQQQEQQQEDQEMNESVVVKEVGEDSIANDAKFNSMGVTSPKQWTAPLVKTLSLSKEQKDYLNSLQVVSIDADTSPKDCEFEPEEFETMDLICNVANAYTFYVVLNKNASIRTIWRLENNLIRQEIQKPDMILNEE